jgi:hypothetical protein
MVNVDVEGEKMRQELAEGLEELSPVFGMLLSLLVLLYPRSYLSLFSLFAY